LVALSRDCRYVFTGSPAPFSKVPFPDLRSHFLIFCKLLSIIFGGIAAKFLNFFYLPLKKLITSIANRNKNLRTGKKFHA
jgi:hypothetical protein